MPVDATDRLTLSPGTRIYQIFSIVQKVRHKCFDSRTNQAVPLENLRNLPSPRGRGLRGGGKMLKLLIKFVTFSPPPSPIEGGGEIAWGWSCFEWFIEMPHFLNVTKFSPLCPSFSPGLSPGPCITPVQNGFSPRKINPPSCHFSCFPASLIHHLFILPLFQSFIPLLFLPSWLPYLPYLHSSIILLFHPSPCPAFLAS